MDQEFFCDKFFAEIVHGGTSFTLNLPITVKLSQCYTSHVSMDFVYSEYGTRNFLDSFSGEVDFGDFR